MQLRLAYSCTNLSGRSKELLRASITEFDASLMNPSYSNSRRRSSSTARSRMNWLRWVIHVVKIEAEAPARDPSRAAVVVIIDESIAPAFFQLPLVTDPLSMTHLPSIVATNLVGAVPHRSSAPPRLISQRHN